MIHIYYTLPISFSFYFLVDFRGMAARLRAFASFVVRFPISQPHPRNVLTTFGNTAAVRGTRMKMKDLWIA